MCWFDTWFSCPAQLVAVKNLGLDSIAMVKKSSRIRYEFDGKQLSLKKIYGICKKRRGRSKYLLSVDVLAGRDQKIPARIVCVRNRSNEKDWIAFISTDMSLTSGRNHPHLWQTLADRGFLQDLQVVFEPDRRVPFLSYDALTAHVAVVFARYMMIALEQRRSQDKRTLGGVVFLFYR